MEVREIKTLKILPKVFMTNDLVKHATVENFVNCAEYVSRSGKTMEGCLLLSPRSKERIRVIRGIAYVPPFGPLFGISFRHKHFYSSESVKEFIESLDIPYLKEPAHPFLIQYDNYGFRIFDRFVMGRMYEFPIIGSQGHLTIYQVPGPVNEVSDILFEKRNTFGIYNHTISSESVLNLYSEFHSRGGNSVLIYAKERTKMKIESPDHGSTEVEIPEDGWALLSHPLPRRGGGQD